MQQNGESNGHQPDRAKRDALYRAAVLAGDTSAWRTWMEDSFEPVRCYIHWRLGGDEHGTDETVQQTWLTAVRCVRRFDPARGCFTSWVRGIAANCIRKHLSGVMRRNGTVHPLNDTEINNHAEAVHANDKESLRIALTLGQLNERYESVLRCKYLDGMTVVQIADQWNQTPKAIESLLTRARNKFRKLYQEESTG